MSFGSFLFGKKERMQQVPTQTPQGMELLQQLMSQGKQNTDFGGIENLARKRFSENTIPSLAERFSSMGSQGAQRSSEFGGGLGSGGQLGGALGGAGADLEAQLASLRSQYGLQQSQMGLTPQFENMFRPQTFGLMGGLAGPALKMGMGMGTGAAMGHGLMGRGMMNAYNGQGGQQSGGDMSSLIAQLLPMLMMGGI